VKALLLIFLVGVSLLLCSCAAIQSEEQVLMNTEWNTGVTGYDMRPDNYFNDPRSYNMWQDIYYNPYRDGKAHYYLNGNYNVNQQTKKTDYSFTFTYTKLW
jgi:hypothetical protein